jgi:hypothetical protein
MRSFLSFFRKYHSSSKHSRKYVFCTPESAAVRGRGDRFPVKMPRIRLRLPATEPVENVESLTDSLLNESFGN